MTTIVKRLLVLTLAGFMLVFSISGGRVLAQDGSQATAPATPAANTNLPASQPVIQGTVNGAQSKSGGVPGSYCWPQANATTPECDIVDDPQPTASISVNNNDGILFTLDPAVPGPASLKGVLLDDKNADGEQPQVDLTATGGIFTVESLNPGTHRLQVSAVYPGDVEGNQPFVTYVFLLSVGSGSPANATAEATPVQAIVPPTTEPATPANVQPTAAQPTAAQPTVEQPTVAQPTVTAIQPTTEPPTPTEVPAQPTVVQPTVEQPTTVLPTATEIPAQPTVVQPTVEQVQPTATEAQAVAVQPTTAETTVAPTPAPANTGGTNVTVPTINVPPATLIVNARTFDPIAINTCVKGDQNETVCINRPTNTTIQKVFAAAGDVAQITFGGPRPTSITVTQLSSDGTKTIATQALQGDNLVLYTLPAANGNFILDIQIIYPQGKVDYFFRLAIGS